MVTLKVLKTYPQFQDILKQGYKIVTPAFVVYKVVTPPEVLETLKTPEITYGIIASKKVGNAVVRNRCKRRLRELIRQSSKGGEMAPGVYVFIARFPLMTYDFDKLTVDFKKAMDQKGILDSSRQR